ncbi:6-bladed beta-propeller [Desulfuromonas sp. AOP6]|uniref:6-bladed beta-propeller n=1 Tax=Desulfuromonas sp. AOP6 TaxID=1566351 RepID=UPI0012810C1D|nr:6-bladed beta-propeller [Desulfuromonas sp. AOP6]BCA79393.1 hypothetical protein AOP6_1180 [Desulfuromonas sp. AOP6]
MDAILSSRRSLLGVALLVLILVSLGGCALRQEPEMLPEQQLVWPGPPLPPRIAYLGEIRSSLDVVERKGFWQKFRDTLFGREETGFRRPYGVSVGPDDEMWLTDPGAGRLYRLDLAAKSFAIVGAGQGLLSPIGITVDDTGRHYVTDSEKGAIYVLAPEEKMQPLFSFVLRRPTGIAFSPRNGWLYVSETEAHQVVAFDRAGIEQLRFGARGDAPGRFNYPTDLWIADGRLYVTDALNSRIQVFSLEGQLITSFGSPGDTAGSFAKPKGVATDSEGHIYICDALFDAVQIFDAEGRLLLAFGESGGGPGQFWMPAGIHIDGQDRVYVVDAYNRRVQIFQYLKEPVAENPERRLP